MQFHVITSLKSTYNQYALKTKSSMPSFSLSPGSDLANAELQSEWIHLAELVESLSFSVAGIVFCWLSSLNRLTCWPLSHEAEWERGEGQRRQDQPFWQTHPSFSLQHKSLSVSSLLQSPSYLSSGAVAVTNTFPINHSSDRRQRTVQKLYYTL